MKTCTKCREAKHESEFHPRGDRIGRLRSSCKSCNARGPKERARRNELRADSPERTIRDGMIQRCHNPENPSYTNYGARGISVHPAWRDSFEAFLRDVGPRPSPRHTIERIDNAGNYEPGNVRWATRKEQNRNTRQNVLLTINGETKCRSEWAEEYGIEAATIRDRMEVLGWDAARAVLTPVDERFGTKRRTA